MLGGVQMIITDGHPFTSLGYSTIYYLSFGVYLFIHTQFIVILDLREKI